MRSAHTPIVIAFLLIGLAGCKQQSSGSKQGSEETPSAAQTVKLVHPEKANVRRFIERPGHNIEAFERTPIYAKTSGYVLKWNFDIGDKVSKDKDILAEIDVPELEVEVEQKKAAVERAEFEIKQAEATELRTEAEQKRAKRQYDRLAGLTGVIDKDQVDEYRLGFEVAEAAVAKAKADVSVARARLRVARADQKYVETLQTYTIIRPPYDGIVTARTINTGDFVQPAGKGESLFVVERINPVRVFVHVPELDAACVCDKDVAIIRVQGLLGQQFKGEVTRRAKSLNPQNRTLRTEVDLPNDDGKLLPGMFVNATIIVQHHKTWALPSSAVITRGDESYAYRIEGGKTVRTPVQLALRGHDPERKVQLVEVVKKRLSKDGAWTDITSDDAFIENAAEVAEGQAVSVAK